LGNEDDAVVGQVIDKYVYACIQDDIGDWGIPRAHASYLYVHRNGATKVHKVFDGNGSNGYGRSSKMSMHKSGLIACTIIRNSPAWDQVGFRVSEDFGETWNDEIILADGLDSGRADVAIDRNGVIYVMVGAWGDPNVYYWMYSTDKGKTWSQKFDIGNPDPINCYAEDLVMSISGSILDGDFRISTTLQGPPSYVYASDTGWVWLGDTLVDYPQTQTEYSGSYPESGVSRTATIYFGSVTVTHYQPVEYQEYYTAIFRNGGIVYTSPDLPEKNNQLIVYTNGSDAYQNAVVRNSGDTWVISPLGLFSGGSGYYQSWDGKQAAILISYDDGATWNIVDVAGCPTSNSDEYGYRFVDILNDQIFFGYNPEKGTMRLLVGTIDKVQRTVKWRQVYSAPAYGGFHMGDAKIVAVDIQ
jgi:hypothetical protein